MYNIFVCILYGHAFNGWVLWNCSDDLSLMRHDRKDLLLQLDVLVPSVNGTEGIFLAQRVDRGGCDSDKARGIYFFAFPGSGTFVLSSDSGT